MKRWLCFALGVVTLLCTVPYLLGQQIPAKAPHERSLSDVACEEGGDSGRSRVVASGDKKWRAFTEVQARKVRRGRIDSCEIRWTLRLASGTTKGFEPVFQYVENDSPQYNSFDIVGWSADGNLLLAVLTRFAGDWGEYRPLVYYAKQRKSWRGDPGRLLQPRLKPDCSVLPYPTGLTSKGEVLLSVISTENDLPVGQPRCFPASTWVWNPKANQIRKAGPNDTQERYGVVEP